jgi:hypothetical protein
MPNNNDTVGKFPPREPGLQQARRRRTKAKLPPLSPLVSLPLPTDGAMPMSAAMPASAAMPTPPLQRKRFHPCFQRCLEYLTRPLVPLVSVTTGQPHPAFPRTILAFHLLTSDQLDDLSRHYHQVWPPVPETFNYPIHIPAWVGTGKEGEADLDTKRRRFGRFVGLRDCESPVKASFGAAACRTTAPTTQSKSTTKCDFATDDDDADADEMQPVLQHMEQEWQAALLRARLENADPNDPDAALRRKACGYY